MFQLQNKWCHDKEDSGACCGQENKEDETQGESLDSEENGNVRVVSVGECGQENKEDETQGESLDLEENGNVRVISVGE